MSLPIPSSPLKLPRFEPASPPPYSSVAADAARNTSSLSSAPARSPFFACCSPEPKTPPPRYDDLFPPQKEPDPAPSTMSSLSSFRGEEEDLIATHNLAPDVFSDIMISTELADHQVAIRNFMTHLATDYVLNLHEPYGTVHPLTFLLSVLLDPATKNQLIAIRNTDSAGFFSINRWHPLIVGNKLGMQGLAFHLNHAYLHNSVDFERRLRCLCTKLDMQDRYTDYQRSFVEYHNLPEHKMAREWKALIFQFMI
jgi:hypothetical protein